MLLLAVLFSHTRLRRWRPPRFIRERTEEQNAKLREKNHILVDGEDVPPPITNFMVSLPFRKSYFVVLKII